MNCFHQRKDLKSGCAGAHPAHQVSSPCCMHASAYSSLSNNCADGINVQAGKFSKINNCADWNKDVQAGIFIEITKLCSPIISETRVIVKHH